MLLKASYFQRTGNRNRD